MTQVLTPGSPIFQLCNLCFVLSALVSDVLLIRLFLVLANAFLLASALLGFPPWPSVEWTGAISVDVIVWSSLALSFHALSFYLLLWDERRIKFASSDEEQLWRFFYRRSGMGRLEMKEVLKYGRWLRVPKGGTIARGYGARLDFHLLVEGLATVRTMYRGQSEEPFKQYSGCCFDLGTLNVHGIFLGFEKTNDAHTFLAVADTDCLLYTWTIDELATMATDLAPAVGAYWRYFTLAQLGHYFRMKLHPAQDLLCATGEPELDTVRNGGRSRDFTDPLRSYEQQSPTLSSIWHFLKRSFHPFPPPGLRHTDLPITGIMARNRVIALKTARAKAALEQQEAKLGKSEEAVAEALCHGGRIAYDILTGMQSLRRVQLVSVEELLEDVSVRSHVSTAALAPLSSQLEVCLDSRSRSAPSSPVTRSGNHIF